MSNALMQPSFAAGEISPNLYARVDLAKYHIGAALLRNCFVDYKGGAPSRPGTKFIGKSKQAYGTPPRLVPFQFSQTQTYVLEFGDQYIRFITNGGYILETVKNITGITKANPGVLTSAGHGFSNGDWVQLANIVGMTQLNGKTFVIANATTNTFTLVDLWGNSVDTTNYSTYVSGGTAQRYYTIVSPYAAADLPNLKWTQSADTLTITHPSYSIYQLKRLGQTNWTITSLSFAAIQAAPVAVSAVPSNNSPTPLANFAYVVTAINAATGEESVASNIVQCQSVDIAQTAGSITITWNAAVGANAYNVYKAPVGYNTASTPVGAMFGLIGTTTGLQFVDGNIAADDTQTPPLHFDPFAPGSILNIDPTAVGTGYGSSTTVSISDPTGTGAIVLPIIISGAIQGYVVVNGGKNYTSPTLSFGSTGGGTGAAGTIKVNPLTGTTPSVTAYFQQRQYYANSTNLPDTFWATKTGQYLNMDASDPPRDDDAITDTISAQQVNGIQAMVPMPTGLVVLTGLGAWQLTGGGQSTAVTPANADATAQAYNGCHNNIPPITVNYDILFVQEKGSIIRDLAYNFFINIYTGTDITVLSSHLFTGHQINEWCWSEEPYKLVFATRDDGVLLTMTYLKEQDVYAWTHSDTFGLYISLASVSEFPNIGGYAVGVNAVYTVVQRFINNQWVYYVERFNERIWNSVEDVWAVDVGLQTTPTYPNATLTLSAASGSATAVASSGVFNNSMVGQIIRGGGGIMTITGYTNSTTVSVNITQAITSVLANNPGAAIPVPLTVNQWSLWTPVTSVSGLDHLIGATVSILADGSVQTPRAVDSTGTVTLDSAQQVSKVTIGLGFQAQVQSLDVDVGTGSKGTIQGKRKNIPALTARVLNSRGIKMGRTFATLAEFKQRGNAVYAGNAIPLFTGDERMVLDPLWDVPGQVCLQQDYPLPMTILGIIPEINVGDTDG